MAETITISNDISKESKVDFSAPSIVNEKPESKFFTYEDLQSVIKRGGKRIPVTKQYDPKVFWNSMGERFYRAFDKPEKCLFGVEFFIDRLKEFQPIESILEVGCGFGRMAPFFMQAKIAEKYHGIDICESILKCSSNYLNPDPSENADLNNINDFFMNGNISSITKAIIASDVDKLLENIKKSHIEKSKKSELDCKNIASSITFSQGDARSLKLDSESYDCVISSEVIQHINPEDAMNACRELVRISKRAIILAERWAFPGEHSEPHIWSHDYSRIFTDLGLEILQVTTIAQGLQGVVVRKR